MPQNILAEVFRHYPLIAPTIHNTTDPSHNLLQELELLPQGIPALYAYSERHVEDHGPGKALIKAFIEIKAFFERHGIRLPHLCLLSLACALVYLSGPMIRSVLSSVLESTGQVTRGLIPRPLNPSANSASEQETVTFTIDELMWLKDLATDLLANEDEAKIRQGDMLTEIGDLEDENEGLKDDVTRLEKKIADDTAHFEAQIRALTDQHDIDKDNGQRLWNERENYRLSGKDLKDQLEKLQKEYNDLEDDRDDLGEMAEELRDDLEDMTVHRDDLKKANGLLKIENEELEAKATIDEDAAKELEDICEDLDKEANRQKRELQEAAKEIIQQKEELQEAAKETADLRAQIAAVSVVNWEGLDDFESSLETEEPKEEESAVQATGSQVGVEEDTSKPNIQPKTVEQREAEIRKLKKELDELQAVHRSCDTWRGAIFEQPEGLNDNNVDEGAPLRRIQSAPLWLPLSHHGDTFDPLYDVSEYGDDDDHDDDAGDEDRDEGQSDQDAKHDSGDDNGNGSDQDENDDDDDDDGRDGGAEKVAVDAHQTPEDHSADTTPLSEDTPSPDTPLNDGQIPVDPEASPRQALFNLNVAAPDFVPTTHPTRPVPCKAMGPEEAKNAHIKKLNEELKRRVWMEKSGKPDLVEDKEGVAATDDVLDNMYERQIAQFLHPDPIQFARGSMWGALNDIPDPLESMSIPSSPVSLDPGDLPSNGNGKQGTSETSIEGALDEESVTSKKDDDATEASQNAETQQSLDAHSSGSQEGDEELDEDDGEWSNVEDEDHEETDAVMPMLGRYQVTRGQKDDQKDDATPMLGNYKVTRGPEPTDESSEKSQKKPTLDTQKANRSLTPARGESGVSNDEEESEAAGDWTDVEDGTDEEVEDDEDSPQENGGMPTLGKYKVTRGDTPSDGDHETPEAGKESGHDSSPSMACGTSAQETSRQDVTTPVRVSQFAGPSTSDSDTTNQPGDAAVSRAPPHGPSNPTNLPKPQPPPGAPTGPRAHTSRNPSPESSDNDLQTSVQLNNLDTTPRVRLPAPRQCGIDNPDPTPRVRLPQQPMQNQTQPALVTPSTRTSTQGELDNSTNSQPAIFRQAPRTLEPQSKPANQGSPLRDVSVASPFRKDTGGMQDGNRAPPTGPAAGIPHWSPRGNARGGRGGRGARQLHRAPARTVPADTPRTGPTTPALGSGNQSPDFSVGGGDEGGRSQQGPVGGSIPRGPAAATATNNTPTRQSGRERGPGTANSSFQRFQERMAMEKRS